MDRLLADPETLLEPAFVLFGRRLNAAETLAFLDTLEVGTHRRSLSLVGDRVVLNLHDDSVFDYADAREGFEASLAESLGGFEGEAWHAAYVSNQARRLLEGVAYRSPQRTEASVDEW